MPFDDDAVDLCRRYTGESWSGAKERIGRLPHGAALIPAAAEDQAFLDAQVLRALLEYPTTYTTRPLRILSVIPQTTRTVVRFAADSDPDGLADLIAWGLFSTAGEDYLHGVSGLRIIEAGHGRLDASLLGTEARIRLEGIPDRAWADAAVRRHRAAAQAGDTVPFQHPELTPGELAFTHRHAWHGEAWRETSALGSALLRRLLIFRSAADWLDMAGYTKRANTHSLVLTFAESRWPDHDTLIEHLTHPVCGIAFTEHMRTCTCAMGRHECRIWLAGPENAPGLLDLRFHSVQQACEVAEYSQELAYAGSPAAEIARVTGYPPGATARCSSPCRRCHGTITSIKRRNKA